MNSASPPPIPSKLALSAHLAGVRARRGRRTITPVPQFRGERDLASPAHPPPPPRKAGDGREEVEGDDEAEEERAHGDGATAATWKPMTLFRCGVGRGLERPLLADWPLVGPPPHGGGVEIAALPQEEAGQMRGKEGKALGRF
ncbi:hypothetical protein BDA96_09G164500 [Sorghum bicolor]|uniref:Uncharacterized protein n=1 Tax=Sorghum bicolor TaxID=4558 RepID=A0A921U4Z3_SORBI|nr:hypothetical protein BDA96_09G164500 [Sorghum bicolor]